MATSILEGSAGSDVDRSAAARRRERAAVGVLLLLILALRVPYVAHYRVDSDEPQHLHVAWAWANGLVQYRDVFDNHAPLFHVLCAPLVRLLGERPDAIADMRVAMLLPWAIVVAATGVVAGRLFSVRVGWWSLPIAALAPAYFLTSVEFRTDDAWAALFLCALAVLVGTARPAARAFRAGLLLGTALAVSMKTCLLLAGVVVGGLTVVALVHAGSRTLADAREGAPAHARDGRAWRTFGRATLAGLAGLVIMPAAVVAWFAAEGALAPMLYGTVWHNALPGLGLWHRAPERVLLFPTVVPLLFLAARWLIAHGERPGVGVRRAFVLLVAGSYVVLLEGAWPLITTEDWLPVAPLLALACAALLVAPACDARSGRVRGRSPALAVTAILAVELVLTLRVASPLADGTSQERGLLSAVLRLTRPGEFVMDAKGETVFRPRPYYYALEYITKERLKRGLIRDDVPERLIATRTAVVAPDAPSFPHRARAFMLDHYVSVGDVRVLGRWLVSPGAAMPTEPVAFDVAVDERYALVAVDGDVHGWLDGRRYEGPRELAPGLHEFRGDPDSGPLALVWARAAEEGFLPVPPAVVRG